MGRIKGFSSYEGIHSSRQEIHAKPVIFRGSRDVRIQRCLKAQAQESCSKIGTWLQRCKGAADYSSSIHCKEGESESLGYAEIQLVVSNSFHQHLS